MRPQMRPQTNVKLQYLHVGGYRFLSATIKTIEKGDFTSDFFGYMGLGSGEFTATKPTNLPRVSPMYVEELNFDLIAAHKDNPDFLGLLDSDSPCLLFKGSSDPLNLPFRWDVYTQLGSRFHASSLLSTMQRVHFAYETKSEQNAMLDIFLRYVKIL